ncbi:hypothetical protein [Microlunatus flavus]|uniref:Uncharacterized protein n=1 Tax=Microlunatus flavus TaxID=1036181 RepID=A0A1H9N8D4_9ACTN|nr:hypothetical protein [Microlunatus flavus]SER32027.1 hypothetical protein SAMN05421756_11311 [Microlunatus flavus]
MSKVDAQRAMREAKYARLRASGPTRREAAAQAAPEPTALVEEVPATTSPAPKVKKPRAAKTTAPTAATGAEDALLPVEPAATDGLCGHKSMNGRACTRPAGHAEKSHRYG